MPASLAQTTCTNCKVSFVRQGLTCPGCADLADPDPSLPPVKPDLRIIDINLFGLVYTTKLAMHYFRQQNLVPDRDRCLILKASVAAYVDQPGSPQQVISQELVVES